MRLVTSVQFDENERDIFERALAGQEHALIVESAKTGKAGKEPRYPVRALLGRIRQEEPLDANALRELESVLMQLIELWRPLTTVQAWRAMGAPGSDDAIEGLAKEKRNAIDRAAIALGIVSNAIWMAGAPPITRRERMASSL